MKNEAFLTPYTLPYTAVPKFEKKVVYMCMEYAIHPALKIYSGGLGFLAGSHMRSAYALKQNLIGIGVLWKYGYYDQVRRGDQGMEVLFQEKTYNFLQDTGIRFDIMVNNFPVKVMAWYLAPDVFNTAPIFLLSTDLPENDYLSRTISHRLYDSDRAAKIAQEILLGVGGAKLVEILKFEPEVFHMNEAHALPAVFYQMEQKKMSREKIKELFVFTTHTPEEAGNEIIEFDLLSKMGFFADMPIEKAEAVTKQKGPKFNLTLGSLRLCGKANTVSKVHAETARRMWSGYPDICPMISITNSQNFEYWADKPMYEAAKKNDDAALKERKIALKTVLFEYIAEHRGKIFDPRVLTVVWARRFESYKRPELITQDSERFLKIIENTKQPIQIIWAGKPHPSDRAGIELFNRMVYKTKDLPNTTTLTGYEMRLSKLLKQGADVWLNTPRVPREASGTSGMTAAMNGAINVSTRDGWIPEFARPNENCFLVSVADASQTIDEQDIYDRYNFLNLFEKKIIPMYYQNPEEWLKIVKQSMHDVAPRFDSDRMATEYYQQLYGNAPAV